MDPLTLVGIAGYAGNTIGKIASYLPWLSKDYRRKQLGSGLTSAEVQQNQFNASEAQKQRDFERGMFDETNIREDTVNQRTVADMKAAGLNPAMMYGSNGGATAGTAPIPSGSAASGSLPSNSGIGAVDSIVNAMMAQSQMKLLQAQARKEDAQADNLSTGARLNETTIREREQSIAESKTRIDGMKLDNEQKSVILKYLDRQQSLYTDSLALGNDEIKARIGEIDAKVKNLDHQNMEILARITKYAQEIQTLRSQAYLNSAQAGSLSHLCKVYDAQVTLLSNQSKLTEKDINWYTADHLVDYGTDILGSIGSALNPFKGMFGGKGRK